MVRTKSPARHCVFACMRFLLVLALITSTAFARPIEVGRNVRGGRVVDAATEFTGGTSVVALSTVTGAADKQVIHVWRRNGALFEIQHMKSKSDRAVSSSRVNVIPGSWTVDVYVGLGPRVGRASFVVR